MIPTLRRTLIAVCFVVTLLVAPGVGAIAQPAFDELQGGLRDTSVWFGSIGDVGVITGDAISDAALRLSIDPNVVSALTVYDAMGGRVAVLLDEYRSSGRHTHRLDPAGLAAGVYHCRIVSGGLAQVVTFLLR